MTSYLLRTDLAHPLPPSPDVRILDWAPGNRAATMQTGERGPEFFAGWRPTRAGADLMLLGAGAYCVDRTARRRPTADAWTRSLQLRVPVADADVWASAKWDTALGFLTGDDWHIEPYYERRHPLVRVPGVPRGDRPMGLEADGICLFSGGLDSLCGVIDLLEEDPQRRLCLLSHHEGGQASTAQVALLGELVAHYGRERITSRRLYLRPAPSNQFQARPLPTGRENTTRSRSLLFLSTALAMATATGPDVPVYVPENGFIGINVPLTRARAGSLSTRTTHPHFMHLLAEASTTVGVPNLVINPYRLTTKGEILAQSRNPGLLRRLAPLSVSCAHPETARYAKRPQGNCGYCFPCLIRRASLAHVGWDTDTYAWNVLAEGALLEPRTRRGADLRAIISGAFTNRPDRDILRNGPLPRGEGTAFLRVWRQGLVELRTWLEQGAKGDLAALLGAS
ncbi:Qat anti-phage system QueC-like protein QatC [Verrucosispora sp. WMMD703]|uniref:Qat anti-phage system QueC-like protein QatC n=1 Tax=Verrucosispora sp. WMMD703 TaxID=3403463 RepID=UPI003B940907